jgi:sugar lactone lactonase YvrE
VLAWTGLAGGTQPYATYESAVAADGPVAQYRFDDAVGSSTLADSAGSFTASNSGIVLGGEGPFGGSKSGSFSGLAFASLPSNPLAGATAFSAEGWVDWTGGSSYKQSVFDFGSSSTNYMYLTPASALTGHKMLFEIRTSAGTVFQVTAPTLKSKAWEYVAVTETSSGTLTLYLNGEQVGETTGATITPSSLGSTPDDYLGESLISGEPLFNGSMSNVAFYSKALTASQIQAHYNAGEFPVNTVAPTISGTAKDGKTLTAKAGTWTGLTPITFAYQWTRCNPSGAECASIPAATETKYMLSHEDVGRTLRVAVSATNSTGAGSATSAQTSIVEAIKPSNTALPVISGTAKVGQLLSVSNGGWEGSPVTSYTYQWEACNNLGAKCKAISGATESTYRIIPYEIADTLRAVVTAANSGGSASATSELTGLVGFGVPVNVTSPAISGTARDGQTLTASGGSWAGTEPITYAYQWQSCNSLGESCSNVSGATSSTYVLGPSNVGNTLRMVVAATNAIGSTSAASSATAVVAAIPPSNTAAPVLTGTAKDGQTLTASTGTWTGTPTISYTYQWQTCNTAGEGCSNISGATGSTYLLGHGDTGTTLRALVTATNSAGSATATSQATAVVTALVPSNTTQPAITGTVRDGETLTAGTGTWSGTPPLSYAYQWESCNSSGEGCSNISEASGSTYVLGHGDVGMTLRVTVTVSNSAGSASSTSEATAVVEALAPSNTAAPAISGEAKDGQALTASTGSWTGTPLLIYTYQWQSCDSLGEGCLDVSGATNASYTLGAGEVGMTIRVIVTATNSAGSTSGTSEATAVVSAGSGSGGPPLVYLSQFGSEGSGNGQFNHPADVAVDANGHLWVLDRGNDRVQEFNEAGEYLKQFGSAGSGNGQMSSPDGLAVNSEGDVWVLDTGNSRIEEFSENGVFMRTAGVGLIRSAEGIAVDRHGDVWVSATYGGHLVVFNSEGEYSKTVGSGGSGPGQLDEPEGLTVDASGHVWVAEWANNRVQEFNEAGEYLSKFGSAGSGAGEISRPYGITAGGGHVFVGEAGNNRVQEFNEEGGFAEQLGTQGSEPGQLELSYPVGLATDSAEDVWITDSGNNRVEEWVPETPAAPSNTSPPSVSGEPVEGETLSVNTGGWRGSPRPTFTYQWQSCDEAGAECANIAGATSRSYVLGSGEVGSTLRVLVTATNTLGSATAASGATSVISTPVLPSNTSPPSISGEPVEGETLSASTGVWAAMPSPTYTYQWQSCNVSGEECADIEGATEPEYTLGAGDVGTTLRVIVTAENSVGSASSASGATAVVSIPIPPLNLEPPSVSGESVEGQSLTAAPGIWVGTEPIEYGYQWEICEASGEGCSTIRGATSASFEPDGAEVGEIPRVVVTVTNVAGSTESTSNAAVVQPQGVTNIEPPTISGTVEEGQILHSSEGRWGGTSPFDVTYQWESCNALGEGCIAIPGATGAQYLLSPSDVDGTMRVIATAANSQGDAEGVSEATTIVIPGAVYYVSQFGAKGSGGGQFEEPSGVAIAPDGDIWVSDRGNDRVEEFNQTGTYLTQFGEPGSGEGQFDNPDAIAVNSSGDVWVLDTGNDRVEEFTESGEYLKSFGRKGGEPGEFELPWGIAVGREGEVWVSDPNNSRIEEFTESGEYVREIQGNRFGEILREPKGLAVDPRGDVWVADPPFNVVDEYNPQGKPIFQLSPSIGGSTNGGASSPIGLTVDSDGNVWLADYYSNRVKEFNEHGEYVAQFGSEGQGEGQFKFGQYDLQGLAVSTSGEILVTNNDGDSVERWQTSPTAPIDTLKPSISGQGTAGITLRASEGEWTGAPVRYGYQWQRCSATAECDDISGATGASYTLTNEDVGSMVQVAVTAFNAGGSASAVSSPTAAVDPATLPSNEAAPEIAGTVDDGQTLTASTGTWGGTPASSYGYQWESCNASGGECAPIESATGSEYTLGDGDIATSLRVIVTATNDAGSAQASSTASAPIQAEPPGELEVPTVSGVPDASQVLYASHGAWTGTERQFSYQWESCNSSGAECAAIEGATGEEYDLGEGDISTTVRVRIGMHSATGSLTDVSAVTPVVGASGALASTSAPGISGAPQVGQTVSASPGSWSVSGALSYSYQWQRCDRFGDGCADIEGATAPTYALGAGDTGDALRVLVTASGEGRSLSRISSATQPVAATAAPVLEHPPLIEGAALEGHTLTATTGRWSQEASSGYSYQWERCTEAGECTAIASANASAYTLTEHDVGSTLLVLVTASTASASTTAVSTATARVAPEALLELAPPSISGVVELGGELAAEPGIWSGAGPVSYAYQWESCNAGGSGCTPIEGAGEPAYPLVSGDIGATLRVEVTASSPLGSQSALSAATVAAPGGEVTVEQAEEVAQQTDPAVLAPSTTATLGGQTVAAALNDEEQLTSRQALTSSSISKENPGEFAVNTPDGELSVIPLETSPRASTMPTLVNGTVALLANTAPATDTIIRPNALGATTILQLRSTEAPQSFSWEIGLGPDQQLHQLPNDSVAVIDVPEANTEPKPSEEPPSTKGGPVPPESSTEKTEREKEETEPETEEPLESLPPAPTSSTPPAQAPSGELEPQNTQAQYETATSAMAAAEAATAGTTLMAIEAPQVLDADGHAVPASLSVTGNTITLHLEPGDATTFPVLAAIAVAAPSDETSSERDPFEYGLADDLPQTFANQNALQLTNPEAPLHIQTARLVTPWDVLTSPLEAEKRAILEQWVPAVEADGLQPYITFKASPFHKAPDIPEYRKAIQEVIKTYKSQVGHWGAWNEPDLGRNRVHAGEAGQYWQAAESVILEEKCDCTVVAGEFSVYPTAEGFSASTYVKSILAYDPEAWNKNPKGLVLHKAHKLPSTWGLHDYKDVVTLGHEHASKFLTFASGKLRNPQVWISEAGVELHDGVKGAPPTTLVRPNDEKFEFEEQTKAAKAFLALREAKGEHEHVSRIKRVYYYSFSAPTEAAAEAVENEFDSGLFEAEPETDRKQPDGRSRKIKSHNEPRPAYCYLAYHSHRCAPSVVAGNGAYMVNPFGIATKVEFNVDVKNGSGAGTQTKHLVEGIIHPVLVGPAIQNKNSCEPTSYNYKGVATNVFGESTLGPSISGEFGVQCIFS